MIEASAPYLSVVATARNDDHGGNLLHRMQIFVNALLGQANRRNIPVELVLVEWNPPEDRPRLAEALRWPQEPGPGTVRILEVPPELHRRFGHAEALPLYQMIAKNAGIRRARGEFVLATNIDIVFSDEFYRFLGDRRLEKGKMYRVDRYDVMSSAPKDASVDELLDWCKSHLLRINVREGTFSLTPDVLRALAHEDIAPRDSGIHLGRGWFGVEQYFGSVFRWVDNDAEVVVRPPDQRLCALTFDLEPGPGVGWKPFHLQVVDFRGVVTSETEVTGRSLVTVELPPRRGENHSFRFRVVGGGLKASNDARTMNFRVFRCSWQLPDLASGTPTDAPAIQGPGARRPGFWSRLAAFGPWSRDFFRQAKRFFGELRSAKGPVRMGLPFSPRFIERLQLRIDGGGMSMALDRRMLKPSYWLRPRPAPAAPRTEIPVPPGESAVHDALHTNGCGDFTLLAREHWLDLRGYPEFDLFSMNIDSVFCYAAHYGGAREEVLEDPIRIYHIEHATGSGWTPEGQAALFERIAAKGLSWVDYPLVMSWAAQMHRLKSPMIFNREDWGLGDVELRETVLPARGVRVTGESGAG